MKFAEQETVGGYLKGEVASVLQKSVRCGDEQAAVFWSTELELTGNGPYVWKRLKIICSEDVGLADSMATVIVRTLFENWPEETKRQKGDTTYAGFHRVYLLHAVIYLARAKKSRALDHALMWADAGERDRPEIPDVALDVHTARGRRRGRGLQHFLEESSRLENQADVQDPYEAEGKAKLLAGERQRPAATTSSSSATTELSSDGPHRGPSARP